MLKTIHLHGAANERFGGPFRMDVRDAPEAVRSLSFQVPGIQDCLSEGHWRIVRGPLDEGRDLDLDALPLAVGNAGELHFIPVPQFSAKSGIGEVLVGVALVAASFALPGSKPFWVTAGNAALLACLRPSPRRPSKAT